MAPDPDSDSELRITIARLARRIRHERASDDYSDAQLSVLFTISARTPITLAELSACERVTAPSMHRTIGTLEAAGLVTRTASPDDGRKLLIDLTPAGRALLEETMRRRDAWFARRLDSLTPDQRRLLAAAAPVLRELAE